MRTKFSNGCGLLTDRFIKMKGPTSMYQSKSGMYRIWDKGKRVLDTIKKDEAEAEYEKRCAQ